MSEVVGGLRVLLIDDEPTLAELVKLHLELSGAACVELATSGAEGLEIARRQEFDLVITDYNMPEVDGGQVLDELKARNAELPVLLFTVHYDDRTVLSDEVRDRADGVLRKPLDYDALAREIRKVTHNLR